MLPIPAAAMVDRQNITPIVSSIRSAYGGDVIMMSWEIHNGGCIITYHSDHDEVIKETKPNEWQHVLVAYYY